MDLFTAQLIALLLLFLGTLISGCLPILCFRFSKCLTSGNNENGTNKVTTFLIYFGGGVLLVTSLLHLLPEAREAFEHASYQKKSNAFSINRQEPEKDSDKETTNVSSTLKRIPENLHESFSFPEFIVLCGFFLTYIIEEIIHYLVNKYQSQDGQQIRKRFCSCAQRDTECSRHYKDVKPDRSLFGVEKKKRHQLQQQISAGQGSVHQKRTALSEQDETPADLLRSSIISQPFPNYGTVVLAGTPDPVPGTTNAIHRNITTPPPLIPVSEIVLVRPDVPLVSSPISVANLLTVAALSFHSIFEGFAIGFQKTPLGTWTIFLAVALHKFVIAFVISFEIIVEENKMLLVIAYMTVFSLMSPIGTAIAMSMNGMASVSDFVAGIVNCLATGTLLYVTFYEILQRKNKRGLCGFHRLVATTAGAGFMAALQYVETML